MEYQELYDKLASFIADERGKGEFANLPSYESDIIGTLYYDLIEAGKESESDPASDQHVSSWQDWYWDQIDYLEQWDYDMDSFEHSDIYDSDDEDTGYGDPIGGVYD